MTKPEKLHMLHGPFTSFIQKIIPKDLSGAAPVFCIQRTPLSAGNAWTALTQLELLNQLQRQSYTADSSYYISTMLSTGGRNKKDQFGGLMFIVVDDVGSKQLTICL
jgi:hypothetical protein